MEIFRSLRLDGDFIFRFELIHKPRFGRNIRYEGTMWGAWNEIGPITRIQLTPGEDEDGETGVLEFIVQNGAEPTIWRRSDEASAFERVTGEGIFEPVLPGLVYTPFDLQMPFIYWAEFEYEGPLRIGSRVAQQFRMLPPSGSASEARGIRAVRIAIDDTYNALLRVEVLGGSDEVVLTDFNIESFKKVQNQHIVKRVSIFDEASRDRTTFDVRSASVGLTLDPIVFDPRRSGEIPEIFGARFKEL